MATHSIIIERLIRIIVFLCITFVCINTSQISCDRLNIYELIGNDDDDQLQQQQQQHHTPIVIWHGMGDTCCDPGIRYFKSIIYQSMPDVYVLSLKLGDSEHDDLVNSFFADTNQMVRAACDQILNDPNLSNGYNAIGFSQGAQFLRAVAQRCPKPQMKTLISLGGQHQGVYGLPFCSETSFVCNLLRRLISVFTYFGIIQRNFVQASYWHNPNNEVAYINYNLFLADINQEKTINPEYKRNILNLEAFVLVKFLQDEMVVPIESQWFGFYKSYNTSHILKMEETDLYVQDKLGLRTLDSAGRLHKLTVNNRHLRMDPIWFRENIVERYLNKKVKKHPQQFFFM